MFPGCGAKKEVVTVVDGKEFTAEDIARIDSANKKLEAELNVKTSEITVENGYFVGTVENTNEDKDVRSITIIMGLYDDNDNKLDEEYINIGRLYHGETFKIKQKLINSKEATRYKQIDKQINFF
jgi:hypothetical protein